MRNPNPVALVTGGAGGIGRSICQALAASGQDVVVADLNPASAREAAEEIGGRAVPLDVCDEASVAQAVASALDWRGSLDVVVNCAGWDEFKPFHETDEGFQERVLQINLGGPIRVTRAALIPMLEARAGVIVNIASDAGRMGAALEAVYSGAKGGLIAFTKAIAREYAGKGIRANAVCPGPTDTPLMRQMAAAGQDGERAIASMLKAIPLRRLGSPADVAAATAFLASPSADFITGQTLSVSGGLSMY